MLDILMKWYGHTPPRLQTWVRHWLVMPGKRALSRGVLVQDGFVIAKRLDQSIPFKIWREKNYEPHLSALLRHYMRPGDTFIDVGANIGYFTLLAASCVGATGRVHSFEPNSRVFAELQHNLTLNRFTQVSANNVALSHRAGNVELFFAPEMDSGLSSLRRTSALLTATQTVRAITLDEYVAQRRVGKIRALKMDVEGAEKWVLEGAANLLRSPDQPDVIAFESVQSNAAAFNTPTIAVARQLTQYDYRLHWLADTGASFQLQPVRASDNVPDGTLVALIGNV